MYIQFMFHIISLYFECKSIETEEMVNPDNLCILVVLDHNIRHNSEFDIFTIPPFRLKYENFLCIYVAKFQ